MLLKEKLTNLEPSKPVQTLGAPDLTIFVPSRGRPNALTAFGSEFEATKRENTKVVFILDEDDPLLPLYKASNPLKLEIWVAKPSPRGMAGALNQAFRHYYRSGKLGFAIGFMGDDHRPRTVGWDTEYLHILSLLRIGFVYGNDLFQGEKMPTQVAFTTDIGAALTYMTPDEMHHLNIDLIWLDWGNAIEKIAYLPNVIVEHMHPLAGKARDDKNYRAVNNMSIAIHDNKAYREYHDSGRFAEDVGKLGMLLEFGWQEDW